MKIILTRHGETEENKLGIIQGHLPGKLSKEGIDQAKRLAKRLSKEHIDHIYSSDLARAADTAKEIAKYHPNVKVELRDELKERHFGSFQGKTLREVGWDKPSDVQPADGETTIELSKRADSFIKNVIRNHDKEDTILIVCHDIIGNMIIASITNKRIKGFKDIKPLGNTSVSIFEIWEDKKHKIHLFNCTKHLE